MFCRGQGVRSLCTSNTGTPPLDQQPSLGLSPAEGSYRLTRADVSVREGGREGGREQGRREGGRERGVGREGGKGVYVGWKAERVGQEILLAHQSRCE